MVLDAEVYLIEDLPELLYDIPLDHPFFGGRIPRKISVINHRHEGPSGGSDPSRARQRRSDFVKAGSP